MSSIPTRAMIALAALSVLVWTLEVRAQSPTVTTTSLPDGNVGVPYSAQLAATGGNPPYSWSAATLPAGLSLNPSTGVISGTPTQLTVESWVKMGGAGSGAPSPRVDHTAVWSGSKMIVWGGEQGTSLLKSGGQYDPSTRTWTPTYDTIAAPAARKSHTAVWTGSRMIIWGGITPHVTLPTVRTPTNSGSRYDPGSDSWVATSTVGAPSARYQHTAVWTGSRMLVWGGFDSNQTNLNNGASYDPLTDTWTPISMTGEPPPRRLHSAVWTGTEMIVWGGVSGTSTTITTLTSGGRYNPILDSWTPTTPLGAPHGSPAMYGEGVASQPAFWTGQRMLVWGGNGGSLNPLSGLYDPVSDSWTPVNSNGAPTTYAMVWTGSRLFGWGGFSSVSTGYLYDPRSNTWSLTKTDGAPSPRYRATAIWTGNKCVVWGGTTNGNSTGTLNDGGEYRPNFEHVLVRATSGGPIPAFTGFGITIRESTLAVSTSSLPNGNLGGPYSSQLAASGGSPPYSWSADHLPPGLSVNQATGEVTGMPQQQSAVAWSTTETTGAPGTRTGHSAIWTGSRMIVWGGMLFGSHLNTGGIYDPVANTWTATSTIGAPEARRGHFAVWTGSQMIVWGGVTSNGAFTTGARYSPVSNSWTAMPNIPGVNGFHSGTPPAEFVRTSAVWTGTKLLPDGWNWLYDPSANAWTQISPMPSGYVGGYRSMTWTGRFVIVWGGVNGSTPATWFNTGVMYDTLSDNWSVMSTTNAPVGRDSAEAVWTGTHMVVWGGKGASGLLSSGGRFDPVANTWTSMSTFTGRDRYTTVWTGTRMIIWGGRTSSGADLNTGGIYSPSTNSWTSIPLTSAPPARHFHSAVWTGRQMILWGGTVAAGNVLNDGALYRPSFESVKVTVNDAAQSRATRGIEIIIDAPLPLQITTASLPSATTGVPYNAQLTATGGAGFHNWSVTPSLPSGLSLNSSSGLISGTASTTSSQSYTFTVSDGVSAPVTRMLSLAVLPGPLQVVTSSLPIATVGSVYIVSLVGSGGTPPYSWSVSPALPSGLSLNSSNGQISGIPTLAGTSGHSFTISDGVSTPAARTLGIQVNPAPPPLAFSTTSLPVGYAGVPYSAQLSASGGVPPYVWQVTPALPQGLSLNLSTGAITGTPTAVYGQSHSFTVSDQGSQSAPRALTLTIVPPALTITTAGLPVGTAGTQYFTPFAATGGVPPYTWSVQPTVPSGLTLYPSSGSLSGTPTVPSSQTHTFTVTDSTQATASKPLLLTIQPAGLLIATASLPTANVGSPYAAQLSAAGGTSPYTWTVSPSLPTGLLLGTSTGLMTGTPTSVGSSSYMFTVTDNAAVQASKSLTLVIGSPLLQVLTPNLPIGNLSVSYSAQLTASGGTAPYTWSISPALAVGLSLNPSTGMITGTPLASGSVSHTVTVSDATSAQANRVLGLTIGTSSLHIATSTLPIASLGAPYSYHLTAGAGSPPYAWQATGLPSGLSINSASGEISGVPTALSLESWASMTLTGAPTARQGHTAVSAGDVIIIWAGSGGVSSNGKIYDPPTNTWRNMSSIGAPFSRIGHVSVWTGSRMITWGGDPGGGTNAGGSYDPISDTWMLTNVVGAPSGRYDHTAVWTGSQMLVWGGINGSPVAYLNSGGRYSPTTDSWSATSVTNAPSGRRNHQAVWTGDKMIVWGGVSGSGFVNSGGVYTNTTNSWTTVSLVGAPTVRATHTAVWTGSRMLVWGGFSHLGIEGTGGAYDPVTDSWSPISTLNAPTPRWRHSAVWAGSSMIVWGGSGENSATLMSGGVYDPDNDSWTPMTDVGGAPRASSPALWHHGRMVMWGGHGGSSNVNTGAIYKPPFESVEVTVSDGTTSASKSLRMTVSEFLASDANRDGMIDVVDVQVVVNIILALLTPSSPLQGDANGDNTVDVVDVQTIVNCILSLGPCD